MSSHRKLDELGEAMRVLGAQAILFHASIAERLGLNVSDLRCLALLRGTEPVAAGKVAEITGLTTGAITGVIDRLERAGFVRRNHDPRDRRRVNVELTNDRNREIEELYAGLARAMGTVLGNYTPRQVALLVDFAHRSGAVFREQTAALGRRGKRSRQRTST